MKARYLGSGIGMACVVLLFSLGSASAKDQWIVLSEQVIKATDSGAEIKAEAGKMWKEDIKKTKISVEGADVEISQIVLKWKGRQDETVMNTGVVKAGGQTAEKDAPSKEATLLSVGVKYKILGNKPTATLKVWGYD